MRVVKKKIVNDGTGTTERLTELCWIFWNSLTNDYSAYVCARAWTESWRAVNIGEHT